MPKTEAPLEGKEIMVLFVGILAVTALLSGQLSAYMAVRARGSRSAALMAVLMGATAWWAAWNAAEYLAPDLRAKLIFANLEYLAIAAIPVLWFALGSLLGQEQRGGTARRLPWFVWILPAVTAILVWTDPYLGLVRRGIHLEVQSGFSVIAKQFGPWFWVHSAYSYVLIIAGTVLLLRALHLSPGTRRAQRVTLVAGTLLPVAVNLVYLSGIFPFGFVDPTPLAFSITGLLTVLNLTRFRFLALVTTAQATAIQQLRDAVLILDRDGHLAYVNHAARIFFSASERDVGKRLMDMGPPLADLPLARHAGGDAHSEESVLIHGDRQYDVRSGPIIRRGRRIGSVVTFFDVTRRAAAGEELRKSNLLLEERVAERTRALEESNLKLTAELEQRKSAQRQLAHDVLHDPLTGLANRSLALNRIEQALLHSRRDSSLSYAVLHVNFDGFKAINDRFGRGAGDMFLSAVALRLKRSVRETDLAARLGADEFVVLLEGYGTPSKLEEIVDRLVDNVCVPIDFRSTPLIPSAGIGIVVGTPDYRNPESILHDAEIAVHKAKSMGRGQRMVFSEEMRLQVDERNLLSAALRTAISRGEISLAFQPIVRMNGSLVGWEVLSRWRHERLGPIGPDRFIPLAEESGLIVPLGAYVFLETLKMAASLRAEGLLDKGEQEAKFFAVNVSAIQLGQADFAELVLSSVDRMELPRAMLHLELTESAIMENRDTAIQVIERLSAEGISFKLDDFGTGYSSLGSLHRIPISCVKIDRGFISRLEQEESDQDSARIVRGMISLSHELRKTVVAEGVETEAQVRRLSEYGCDFAQGYYFARPMDKEALAHSLGAASPA